ncbi:MAG: D-alanyl-D-alanine carboxypeptidase, partial [Clostridia bacterium]|nr:D-alanyl-D-alanine carboxypeptidase [Clostridia bacterium]
MIHRLKKFGIIAILCTSLLLMVAPSCFSLEAVAVETDEKTENPKEDSQGRPILAAGETGVLIDAKSGNVLFESGGDKAMYPASTTKVMTALVALEAVKRGEIKLTDVIEITEEMLDNMDPDGTNMALKAGEIISFEALLYGLMIPSGNDAAIAIAYMVAGGIEPFVEKMNQRAAEMGLKDTHFENPHGLHDENHYTTALDMAHIAKVAMENEIFRNTVDIAHIKIPPTNKTEEERYYINTNGLISAMRYSNYYYPKSTGIKTGYTSQAGNCLVASAEEKGEELISVIFGAEGIDNSHNDSKRLFEYGFNNFEKIAHVFKNQIVGEVDVKQGRSKDSVTLSSVDNIEVLVPNGTKRDQLEIRLNLPEYIYAPVEKGQLVGSVAVYLDGQYLGEGELSADVQIKRSIFWPFM